LKAKKYGIIVSIILIAISLFASIGLEFAGNHQFLVNIFLGIFGSAFVTLVIYISEYFVEKRKALETFYECTLKLINVFSKIEYFDMKPPIRLIKDYLYEEFSNDIAESIGQGSSKEKWRALFNYYIKEYTDNSWDKSNIENMARDHLEREINLHKEKLEKVIDSYLFLRDYNFSSLDVAYGNLDFFVANKKLRNWIYTDIYKYVQEKRKFILERAYHFELYRKGDSSNKSAVIHFIEELQEVLFVIETKENEKVYQRRVENDVVNILQDRAETLRAKIYGQKAEKINHIYVFEQQTMKNTKSSIKADDKKDYIEKP